MKKLTLIMTMLLLILSIYGQNIRTVDTLNTWNTGLHCMQDGPFNPYDRWTTSYCNIEGDTTMHGNKYMKLVNCIDSLCTEKFFKFYIREDSGRIYKADKTNELLMYDFNLQKGDTMIMKFFNLHDVQYFIMVDSVKYLVLEDQKERKALYISVYDHIYDPDRGNYYFSDILVEGIGSLDFGLDYHKTLFFTGQNCYGLLLCYYTNKQFVYTNPKHNSCYLATGNQELSVNSELVKLFSIQQGVLTLELKKAKSGTLYIYNTLGQLLKKENIVDPINSLGLPIGGILIYRFESVEGRIQSGKIII